jgi:hypothetical protein
MQMSESSDENGPAFASASGTSNVYPNWETKEIADPIDRIKRKTLSSETILEGTGPATYMTSIHAKVRSTVKYADQYRLIIELLPCFWAHLKG